MQFRVARLAGVALFGFATTLNAAEPGPLDRSPFYGPDTQTSDDLRRVPVAPVQGAPARVVIRNARLFDGTGAPPKDATVVIVSGKVEKILPPRSTDWPKDAQVVDAAGKTVMPGLIDMHTHLTYVISFTDVRSPAGESQADAALRGVERMRYYIESGVTSVRDVASHGMAPFILKRWAAEGRIVGPRIFAAGQLITGEGGHATEGFVWRTAPEFEGAMVREASGPDDWRAAVRHQFKSGADLIKLASHYTQEEISAAVDEAHRLGLKVTVDSETVFTEMAARAGVDSVEHPLPRSDETVRMMAAQGIASVPTIVPYQYIIGEWGGYNGSTSRRFTLDEPRMFDMVRKMKQAGVKLGVGTDIIGDWYRRLPHPYIQELHNFEKVGYTPSEALVAATRTNAEILGMADRLGTLEPGKLADLIIVAGKPDQKLDDLARVETVLVNGRIVVQDGRLFMPRHVTEKTPPGKGE